MPTYTLDLSISDTELARFYGGSARKVLALGRCGTRLQFPAHWLRPFVEHDGVHGSFVLETDADYRMRRFQRL
ncbi:MAG: DUF2835 family protein [Pseudomonadales bacterium]